MRDDGQRPSSRESRNAETGSRLSGRRFLGGVGGAAAAVAASALPLEPLLGKTAAAEASPIDRGAPSTGSRVEQAFQVRLDAATAERARPVEAHVTNGDE